MNSLRDKVALVTGGAQGIGRGIAEALAGTGCRVLLADIREDRLQETKKTLVAKGCQCEALTVNVTEEESVRAMVQRAGKIHGCIDILVNSAGVAPNVVSSIRLTLAEWNRVMNVNLTGVFLCCREVGAWMVKQEGGGGRIINIASLNSVSPAALTVAYNVSKAGVVSLTQTFAIELAGFGIRVNSISPGPIGTEFHDVVMPQRAATLGVTREEIVEKIRAAIPLGRWGTPQDIAKAVLFLASDQADWITGQNFVISGGLAGVSATPAKEIILGESKPSAKGR